MELISAKRSIGRNRKWPKIILLIGLVVLFAFNGFFTPMPDGTSYESLDVKSSNVEFLYDLTYESQGQSIKEHMIFDEQLKLIEAAEDFIILDMFLFNDDYNRATEEHYPDLVEQLTTALIDKKNDNESIDILFITDEINNFYGVYETPYIKRLKDNKIDVVVTDLEKMRDPNPAYAGVWRSLIKWFGTAGKGWLPNPFSPDSPKVTIRGYLKLLNFKANHRKVIITDKAAIVTSMNPHDGSGNHSNIGFKVAGEIIEDLVQSELTVAKLSGYEDLDKFNVPDNKNLDEGNSMVSILTEGKIRDRLINEIKDTQEGDHITLGMFYISHRGIIGELINASNRGVDVKLVLDANKDAFGIEKDGVPNRQAAHEMIKETDGKINIRWYNTQGEQFHTKMTFIEKENKCVIIGGSANLTRRNLDDYNFETNVLIETSTDTDLSDGIRSYFNRIWSNTDGDYTLDYSSFEDTSLLKRIRYRIQEWSGLSSF